MPNATIEFIGEHRKLTQIEVLRHALENERDLYMRCCIKNAIKRLER